MPTPEGKPMVFISYCWDNDDTVRRVNAFADFLDANGVHLEMDRYQDDGSNLYRFMAQQLTLRVFLSPGEGKAVFKRSRYVQNVSNPQRTA